MVGEGRARMVHLANAVYIVMAGTSGVDTHLTLNTHDTDHLNIT